jgi:transcriptional regulator with XRE-family HTH domain
MTPALPTYTSRRPCSATTASTTATKARWSVTSRVRASALWPSAAIDATTSARRSARRAVRTTWWPSAASRRAVAAPMPLLAPVTRATGRSDGVLVSVLWVMPTTLARVAPPGQAAPSLGVLHPPSDRPAAPSPPYRGGMPTPLGEFLRARRARVAPVDVGLPQHGQRRVPGLRREEVAVAAGVSVDYYVRLEQGREKHPSAQVLDALADALLLDDDARLHLHRLAGLVPTPRVPRTERVDPELLRLLDAWPDNPALVLGRAYDVLAANRLGRALFTPLVGPEPGAEERPNLVLAVFADPAARRFYAEWDRVAADTVAGLRLQHGEHPDDPRIAAVLAQARRTSPAFVELWERQDARGKRSEVKRFDHAEVGPLTLRMHTFDVRSAPGQELVVYHAEPGSPSAEGLALLGSLAATATAPG